MSNVGAAEVDQAAYNRLRAQLGTLGMFGDAQAAVIEQSDDYKAMYEHLRMMRRAEPDLVHYVYLLAPTDDPDTARFIADADVLEFHALEADGKPLPAGE